MFRRSLVSKIGLSSLLLGAVMFVSSCSNKITDEQLKQIKDLRAQEARLNDQVQRGTSEKSRLQNEVNARRSDLTKCQQETDFVKAKLANWPNVWPDYTAPTGDNNQNTNEQGQPNK